MTSFVHLNYANEHPGVQRAEAVVEAAGRLRRGFDSTKGLAAMLLAALVAALMVVADQLVSVWPMAICWPHGSPCGRLRLPRWP